MVVEKIYDVIISLFNTLQVDSQLYMINELKKIVFLGSLNNKHVSVLEISNINYICISYEEREYKLLLYCNTFDKSLKLIINHKEDKTNRSLFKYVKETQFSSEHSFEYICNKCLNYNSDSDIDLYFDCGDDINNGCKCESSKELTIKMKKWDDDFISLFNYFNVKNKFLCLEKLKVIINDLYGYFYDLENVKKVSNYI